MDTKEIRIPKDLLEKACREGIDVSQAEEVIRNAEQTSEKVYDEKQSLWHAHMRIGNITLWVSYVTDDGYIEIRDIYMHRMEIREVKK